MTSGFPASYLADRSGGVLAGIELRSNIERHVSSDRTQPEGALADVVRLVGTVTVDGVDAAENPEAIALAVAENFVDAFNSRDMGRSREVFNFPSVLLVRGRPAPARGVP